MSDDQILAAIIRLETGVGSVLQDLRTIREEQTSMRQEQNAFRQELAALRKDVTTLQQGQTALRVDLMERMDRLQDSISACRDDIGVNMARADRAHDVNENTREELRSLSKEVSMMWRQLKQLESKVRGITGEP